MKKWYFCFLFFFLQNFFHLPWDFDDTSIKCSFLISNSMNTLVFLNTFLFWRWSRLSCDFHFGSFSVFLSWKSSNALVILMNFPIIMNTSFLLCFSHFSEKRFILKKCWFFICFVSIFWFVWDFKCKWRLFFPKFQKWIEKAVIYLVILDFFKFSWIFLFEEISEFLRKKWILGSKSS